MKPRVHSMQLERLSNRFGGNLGQRVAHEERGEYSTEPERDMVIYRMPGTPMQLNHI